MSICIIFSCSIMLVFIRRYIGREAFKPSFKILMQTGFIIINENAGGYSIALPKQSPLSTLLSRTICSIWGVILIKADRVAVLKVRYFVKNLNSNQFGGLPAVGDELSPLSVPSGADGSASFFLFR